MARIRIIKRSEKREITIPWRKVHGNRSKKFKVAAPPLSYGMIKKLEPVLKIPRTQRHATSFLQSAAGLTNSGKQDEDRKANTNPKFVSSSSGKAKKDVFAFPSSPKKDVKEKKKGSKEVLEVIKKTRQSILLIRTNLPSYKKCEELPKMESVTLAQTTQRGTKGKIEVTVSVAGLTGITRSEYKVEQSKSCVEEEEIEFYNGRTSLPYIT